MSTGAYGFCKGDLIKLSFYEKEGNPKKLGYNLFNSLYYAWPQELTYMFHKIEMVNSGDSPTEEQYNSIIESLGIEGFSKKHFSELTFYDLLAERQNDILQLFMSVRHSGFKYFLNGIENIKATNVCDWIYLYNLDLKRIEIYYRKEIQPETRTITNNPYIYIEECYDLIHSMDHNPDELARNQFSLDGLDYAYKKVLGD